MPVSLAVPPPASKLARYRILSPSCGMRVSPIQLGAMTFGTKDQFLGEMSEERSYEILDAYYDMGGNYIDTASSYQVEESEEIIGKWMQKRGNREDVVIATKYTSNYKRFKEDQHPIRVNRAGNSLKSMVGCLNASLAKLQTDYVDVFYMHWWDWTTPIPEIMHGLDTLIKQGKVLYLGVSDTPAWVVAKANQYARDHGLSQFVIYQGRWSAAARDLEKDILPMAMSEGMAIAPWGAIGQGKFKRAADRFSKSGGRGDAQPSENDLKVSAALEGVADELGERSIAAVAVAFLMAKYPWVYPVIGTRKVENFKDVMRALDIALTPAQVRKIDAALPFDFGQPQSEFGLDPHTWGYQLHPSVAGAGLVDYVPQRPVIDMTKGRESDEAAVKANPHLPVCW